MPAIRRAVDLTRDARARNIAFFNRDGDIDLGKYGRDDSSNIQQRERGVYTRTRDTATERVAKLFAIAPEDLCPDYSPPDYSPPRDVVVEERLYYDRAKRRQVEGLARALRVSMDERIKKELD